MGLISFRIKRRPIEQADFYLDQVKPDSTEIIALDIEDTTPKNMSLQNAKIFIKRIKEKTGRYPLLYINNKVLLAIESEFENDSVFSKCPLWYARFKKNISDVFPKSNWNTYKLWQFKCEINCCECIKWDSDGKCTQHKARKKHENECPYVLDGTWCDMDMDIDIFYGDEQKLRKEWPFTFKE